jgi:hypothetical protein
VTRMRLRASLTALAALVTAPLVILGLTSSPANAATVVNYTVHVPTSVQTSPCTPGDVVNLSGDIHIVILSTSGGGGYRMNDLLNSELSGSSIVTGTKYVNSEIQNDMSFARPPFPVVESHDYDFTLVSQSGTPNYILHATMHTTVTADGTPSAVVDNWSMSCRG